MTMNQELYSNEKNPEIIIIGRHYTSTTEVDNRTQFDNPFGGIHILFAMYLCTALDYLGWSRSIVCQKKEDFI